MAGEVVDAVVVAQVAHVNERHVRLVVRGAGATGQRPALGELVCSHAESSAVRSAFEVIDPRATEALVAAIRAAVFDANGGVVDDLETVSRAALEAVREAALMRVVF